ncbi:16878_t:CDS:10 [Funneliformis mosseae]|uniref:Anaphase-promoting complex subunit 4 n=1 Tax=Funneliformis mosseae TaxID=27381 RepID=A0A9N9CZU0_FUNMO|nr:16878_t:CDS:10 [Funneliformis mosseae]
MIFQHEIDSHMAFRLMNQHGVNEPIKLISMCPTMDLLAVCTETDSVWVARWFSALEKIWTLPAGKHGNDKVEALAWRPDGKVIALGYSSGAIRLYNVDKLEMIHELFPQPIDPQHSFESIKPSAINFLIWVQENENDSENVNEQQINYISTHPIQRYLPKLSTIPRAKPISNLLGNINESHEDEIENEISNLIDLLIAGDTSGNLHLSVKIINASVTPDLSHITLLVLASYTSVVTKTSANERLVEITLNTGLLYTHKNEIRTLSQTYTIIKYLTEYIFEGMKQIKAEHESMKANAKIFIDKFQLVLSESNANSKLSAEFIHYLASGKPSSLLHKYLEMHLTKRGLKDWESKGQKSFEQIREYIHHYIRPGCERLLLQLSTLIGYCKWQQKFKGLGLSESYVHSIIISTGCLVNRLEDVLNIIDEKYTSFMEFQQWLQYGSIDHNQTHETPPLTNISKIASYIKNSLHMDFLDSYFTESETVEISLPDVKFPNAASMDLYDGGDPLVLSFEPKSSESYIESSIKAAAPAYPYDFFSCQKEDWFPPTFQSFVDMLILRCNKMSTSTAYNVVNSVKAEEFLYIIDNLINYDFMNNESLEGTQSLVLDTRIVMKEYQPILYVAFCLYGSVQYSPPSLWVLRSSLKSENTPNLEFNSEKSLDKRTSEISVIELSNQKQQNKYLIITDMQLFDDEKMHLIITGLDESENEVNCIVEVNYTELNFIQVIEPRTVLQAIEYSKRINVVDQVLNQKNLEKFSPLLVQKYRVISQFKPLKLTTNGARGLACILSEDKKKIIILDTNDQEDEDDTENDNEMMEE